MSGLGLPGDLYGSILPTQTRVNNTTPLYIPTGGTIPSLNVSSINCSSINGASPGGGGSAISTFPNLTTTGIGGYTIDWSSGQNGNIQFNYETTETSSFYMGIAYASTPSFILAVKESTSNNYGVLGVSSLQMYTGSAGSTTLPDAVLDSKGLTIGTVRQPFIQCGIGTLGMDGFSTFFLPVNYADSNYNIQATYRNVSSSAVRPLCHSVPNNGVSTSVSSFSLTGDPFTAVFWTTLGNI